MTTCCRPSFNRSWTVRLVPVVVRSKFTPKESINGDLVERAGRLEHGVLYAQTRLVVVVVVVVVALIVVVVVVMSAFYLEEKTKFESSL